MPERLNNTIETQINDGNTIVSQITDNSQPLQTVIQDVPQVQTVLQNGINVSSQINAPFVEVTSVNGKTGDVITEPVVGVFEPNHFYLKNTMIGHNSNLYYAKETFTSGSSFDVNDWYTVEGNQITIDSDMSTTSENPVQNKVITNALNDKVNSSDLAKVATSGSFTDLINVPTLPIVNDSTLTIQKNGTTVSTFTANSSTDKVANITVPTKTSDITNDSGFIIGIPVTSKSGLGGGLKFDASFLYNCILDSTAFTQEQVEALKEAILADKEIVIYEVNQPMNKGQYKPYYVSASEDSALKTIDIQYINQTPAKVSFSFSSINGADWTLTVGTTPL